MSEFNVFMKKINFKKIGYGNLNPYLLNKGGVGTLTIDFDKIIIKVLFDKLIIDKDGISIRILSENCFQILNIRYKFLYVYTDSIAETIQFFQDNNIQIIDIENINIKKNLFQKNCGKITLIIIGLAFILFAIYFVLFINEII